VFNISGSSTNSVSLSGITISHGQTTATSSGGGITSNVGNLEHFHILSCAFDV
jgi:hypothetical protein